MTISSELPQRSLIADIYFPIARRNTLIKHSPKELIMSGEGRNVYEYCGTFSQPTIARDLSRELKMQLKTVKSNHPKAVKTHVFMEDQITKLIIDPAALQFFKTLPEGLRKKYFVGTMFIGSRENLLEIFHDPGVSLWNISTYQDKELSMRRIYGDNSKIEFFWSDADQQKFYGY